jgi:hypothetical protein
LTEQLSAIHTGMLVEQTGTSPFKALEALTAGQPHAISMALLFAWPGPQSTR